MSDDLLKQFYISETTCHTKMADHFIETLEYEQCKNLDVLYQKVTKSVKIKYYFKIKILSAGWSGTWPVKNLGCFAFILAMQRIWRHCELEKIFFSL